MSQKSVASGLRAWHAFATDLLDYHEDRTLPPRHDGHILRFLAIFRCGSTAVNFVSYLRNACARLRLDIAWRTESVAIGLSG